MYRSNVPLLLVSFLLSVLSCPFCLGLLCCFVVVSSLSFGRLHPKTTGSFGRKTIIQDLLFAWCLDLFLDLQAKVDSCFLGGCVDVLQRATLRAAREAAQESTSQPAAELAAHGFEAACVAIQAALQRTGTGAANICAQFASAAFNHAVRIAIQAGFALLAAFALAANVAARGWALDIGATDLETFAIHATTQAEGAAKMAFEA